LLRQSFGTVALILTSLSLPMTLNAKAETALEVQSWCQDIVHAELTTDKRVLFEPRYVTGFCWGVFGALQEISRIPVEIDGHLYLFCPPQNSTRVQFIKVFSRFVDTHPATANEEFGLIAVIALSHAFPCP
jgi:hypothetical protein